jgi:hypothetical protein
MKKYAMALLALFFAQQLMADSFYEQLCRFNYNWKKYADRSPTGTARFFASEKDLVAAHLSSVLGILRSNRVDHLSPQQHRNRLHLLALLDGYRAAGRFPINSYSQQRTPVFIDEHNTYCAVAYLLQQTGQTAVAQRIAAANNLAWVKDIQDPALPAWQRASGLSLEELKLIQGVYDFYMPNGYVQPNRYEIPQQPSCTTAYFSSAKRRKLRREANIWCLGEGNNGVLHGRWIQNHAPNLPWIIGFYDNGKRTGQWQEYYQGTTQLCRTEQWANDKLNGIRRRFDRTTGELTEEILFKDGVAVSKTNYDRATGLAWVRQPQANDTVLTLVYNANGNLLARGREKVHNPGNLQWFQNIELTALNTMALSARDMSTSSTLAYARPQRLRQSGRQPGRTIVMPNLYNETPLVTYQKEGTWVYYRQGGTYSPLAIYRNDRPQTLAEQFPLFEKNLTLSEAECLHLPQKGHPDSLLVTYNNDQALDVYATGQTAFTHLQIEYHPMLLPYSLARRDWRQARQAPVKTIGERNKAGHKTGVWKHYDRYGRLYKTENFILPGMEGQETENLLGHLQ